MKSWWQGSAERVSMRLLYLLLGVAAVVFVLFWVVGYDRPFEEDPSFSAPLFTDLLLSLCYAMVVVACGFGLWSAVRSLRQGGRGSKLNNNIPAKRIGYSVAGGAAALLLLTFLTGSSAEMTVNGARFADAFWLKASDMFVNTSIAMILVAVGAVLYGSTRYIRK